MAAYTSTLDLPSVFPKYCDPSPRKKSGSSASFVVPPSTNHSEPAYIAISMASQIILTNYETRLDYHRPTSPHDEGILAPSTLTLINNFLDQLLYNIVLRSPSLAMSTIRLAIAEVFNSTLATQAVYAADSELKEYLGGHGVDSACDISTDRVNSTSKFDLDSIWQLLRLRCMAYSSLGDVEEDDELCSKNEILKENPFIISTTAAVFLTSVLEYTAEYILICAGQSAFNRVKEKQVKKYQDKLTLNKTYFENLVVEAADVESIASDRSLGQLWMSRKKCLEYPSISNIDKKPSEALVKPQSLIPDSNEINQGSSRINSIMMNEYESSETDKKKKRRKKLDHEEWEYKKIHEQQKKSPSLLLRLAYLDLAMSNTTIQTVDNNIPKSNTLNNENSTNHDLKQRFRRASSPRLVKFHFLPATGIKNYHSNENFKCLLPLPESRELAISMFPKPPRPQCRFDQTKSPDLTEINEASDDKSSYLREYLETNEPACSFESKSNISNLADTASLSASKTMSSASTGIPRIWNSKEFISPSPSQVSRAKFSTDNIEKTNPSLAALPSYDEYIQGDDIKETHNISSSCVSPGNVQPEANILRTKLNLFPKTESVSHQSGELYSSTSIPRSLDINRSPYSLHSHLRWGNLSRRIKARSDDLGKSWSPKSQRNRSNSQNPGSVSSETIFSLPTVSPEKMAPSSLTDFAAATQGVDILNLDLNTVPNISEQDPDSFTSVNRVTDSLTNLSSGEIHVRPPENDSDGNVSPLSMSIDYLLPNRCVSPVSTVSSMDETPHVEKPLGVHSYCKALKHTPENCAENKLSNYHKANFCKKLSIADSIQSKSSNNTSDSSSSFPPRFMVVQKTVGNPLGKFDQLIQSDQTIQYTLTPQNVRHVVVPEPPQASIDTNLDNSTTIEGAGSSASKYIALPSNQPKSSPDFSQSTRKNIPIVQPASQTQRTNAPQPRDARVVRDSTLNDFASFIRNTGPESPVHNTRKDPRGGRYSTSYDLNSLIRNRSPSPPVNKKRDNNARVDRASILNDFASFIQDYGPNHPVNIRGNKSAPDNDLLNQRPMNNHRSSTVSVFNKLESRDATIQKGESMRGLIDFVRTGPQYDHSPTIFHEVSPFRPSTLSSRSSTGEPRSNGNSGRLSPRTTQNTSSIKSFFTSQNVPLLNSSKSKQHYSKNMRDSRLRRATKTDVTRRSTDPYAIEFSDEEGVLARVRSSEKGSLSDILNNMSPKSAFENYSVNKGWKMAYSPSGKTSLFEGRSTSFNSSSSKSNYDSRMSQNPTSNSSFHESSFEIQSNSFIPRTNQIDVSPSRKRPKGFEPRAATCSRSESHELANFLIQNDPPSDLNNARTAFNNSQSRVELRSFQRIFSRRRSNLISR